MSKKIKAKKNAIGDKNKPRLSFIPRVALYEMGKAFSYGEKKYNAFNWKKGLPYTYLIDAAMRHISQFNDGEDIDEESGILHLANAMTNLAMLIDLYYSNKDMDDRWKKK